MPGQPVPGQPGPVAPAARSRPAAPAPPGRPSSTRSRASPAAYSRRQPYPGVRPAGRSLPSPDIQAGSRTRPGVGSTPHGKAAGARERAAFPCGLQVCGRLRVRLLRLPGRGHELSAALDVLGHPHQQRVDRVELRLARARTPGSRRRHAGRTDRGRRGRWRTPRPCARCRRTAGWCRRRSRPACASPCGVQPARVDTVGGDRGVRQGLDVGRGEAQFAAALGAADDDALHAVRAAQDLGGAPDVALGDQAPGQRGGERLAAARLAASRTGRRPRPRSRRSSPSSARKSHVARPPCGRSGSWGPRRPPRACSLSTRTLTTKSAGRQLRELRGEGQDQDRVHAQLGHQLGAPVVRGEQRRVAAGAHDLAGVRVEGDDDRGDAQLARAVHRTAG